MREFFCMHCEAAVEAESSPVQGLGETDNLKEFYFCPLCGRELGNEPDADAVYESLRDDQAEELRDGETEETLLK
jgi:DNA-directed RNA polymerase subunit RPC12/RpoP